MEETTNKQANEEAKYMIHEILQTIYHNKYKSMINNGSETKVRGSVIWVGSSH
jgi:hypothetical protein